MCFSDYFQFRGARCLRAKQIKAIAQGAQVAAAYDLAIEGGNCVLCNVALPRMPNGQGGRATAPAPDGWRTFQQAHGASYHQQLQTGEVVYETPAAEAPTPAAPPSLLPSPPGEQD